MRCIAHVMIESGSACHDQGKAHSHIQLAKRSRILSSYSNLYPSITKAASDCTYIPTVSNYIHSMYMLTVFSYYSGITYLPSLVTFVQQLNFKPNQIHTLHQRWHSQDLISARLSLCVPILSLLCHDAGIGGLCLCPMWDWLACSLARHCFALIALKALGLERERHTQVSTILTLGCIVAHI